MDKQVTNEDFERLQENRSTAKKETTLQLYETIRTEYKKLKNKKKHGVPVYNEAYILSELAGKFFKSPATISNIVYRRV